MTPRCFAAWSKGKAEASKRRADDTTALAFMTAFFTRTEKRVRLKDFLIAAKKKPRKMTPDEMFAVLLQFRDGGAPIDIREAN
jgi:hypothetical protein